ncbi:19015_t:CDS:2 [Cetraspora pellucida]|uniref:ATP-dependent DNA helicase n=1 Tax=Cetraspora pellucida TaxID=1433469 RepID=A0A9N9EZ67_9GLOM|nr:19015_t:CDS:2 [Cetraspora pellucida]
MAPNRKKLFNRHIANIEDELIDLLGPSVKKLEKFVNDDENEQLEAEEKEIHENWMILAEMGPNAIVDNSSDLGLRNIDRNYNWTKDVKQHYPNLNLADVDTFVWQACNEANSTKTLDANTIDYQTLNEIQMKIFKRFEFHYNSIIIDSNTIPLRVIIMGTAGTGKSYLINAIQQRLQEIAKRNRIDSSPVIVLAPTGVAAFNIHGTTIHSALSLPVNCNNFDINGECLKQLQKKLNGVKYIIIDEKSMVRHRMLTLIDMRLRQAFPENQNQPFGSQLVILVGDFGQLPPVLDKPMYAQDHCHDLLSNDGIASYRQFQEVYQLDIVQCQAGDSEEQCRFRNILLQLRDGDSTIEDWNMLSIHFKGSPSVLPMDIEQFSNITCILPLKSEVNEININKLRLLNNPITRIHAVHTGGIEAFKADLDVAKGLKSQILLARGARVMLRANLCVELGLVNGAIGTVHNILFEKDQGLPSLPVAVFVEFDDYNGSAFVSTAGTCSRLQIPLNLAWAITVHKGQGLTLANAMINLGKKEFASGLSFVAISRVYTLNNILFDPFSFERLQRIKQCKRIQERKDEERRLISMIT